ncbi:transcriptional regulator [bacterium]|nr:transcriptional regulator [bacterium]
MPRYEVQRSITISATPQQVFNTAADYSTWTSWSPWLCAEPDARVTVTDDANSVGSIYAWQGDLVGEGEIEHRDLQSGRLIEDEIRFFKPFRSKSKVSFEFEPADGGTKVTWKMQGSLPWFLFFLTSMMKSFIAMDYDRGLKMLKEFIETGDVLSTTTIVGVEPVGPLQMAGVRRSCTLAEIGPAMTSAFGEAKEKFCQLGLPADGGGAISVYLDWDLKTQTFDFISGFLLPESFTGSVGGLTRWSTPQVSAFRVDHTGRYDHVGNAWSAAHQVARCRKHKIRKSGTFEIYRNDPDQTVPADLKTEVYLPLK